MSRVAGANITGITDCNPGRLRTTGTGILPVPENGITLKMDICAVGRKTTADRTAAHRRLDQRRVCLCGGGLRKRESSRPYPICS